MSTEVRSGPREAAVLVGGVLLGAALVMLGSTVSHREASPERAPVVAAPEAPPPLPAVVVIREEVPVPATVVVAPVAPEPPPVVTPAEAPPVPAVAQAEVDPPRRTVARRTLRQLPDGVVARLRRAHRKYDGEMGRLLGAGAHLLDKGATWKAMVSYSDAYDLNRGNRDALMGLALCHYELGHPKETRQLLQRVLAADRGHPEASILRGFMAQLAGDSARAIEWYERALVRIDDDAAAGELRTVIASLRPQPEASATATASAAESP